MISQITDRILKGDLVYIIGDKLKLPCSEQTFMNKIIACETMSDVEKRVFHFLHTRFLKCDLTNLQSAYVNELSDCIYYIIHKEMEQFDKKYTKLLNKTEECEVNFLSWRMWKLLSRISSYSGMFCLAYLMQLKSMEELENNHKTLWKKNQLLLAYFSFGFKDKFLELLKEMEKDNRLFLLQKYFERLNKASMIIYGNDKFIKTKIRNEDKNFSNLIEGKNIAIIGPSTGNEYEQEINDSDVTVCFAYRGQEYFKNGRKINISYYNVGISKEIEKQKNRKYLDDLDCAVFKKIKHKFQKDMLNKKKVHLSYGFDNYLFMGYNNMLQTVICDLLQFSPKKIKIYNNNLYYSKKPYNKNYITENFTDDFKNWRTFSLHNLPIQYNLISIFLKNPIITGDSNINSVIDMGLWNYLKGMEKLYGCRKR